MPSVGKFSASIMVDGAEVAEYGIEKTKDMVTCYIPSSIDKRFTITLRSTFGETVSFDTYVDGQYANGQLVTQATSQIFGVDVNATSYRPFVFGAIRLSDDDTLQKDKAKWDDLGCIDIKVLRIKKEPRRPVATFTAATVKDDVVHERSKKAGAHRVKLGAAQSRPGLANHVTVNFIDSAKSPYARIRFLYRPKDLLQAQGIMPYTPASHANDADDGEAVESAAVAEKERQLQALLAQADQVRAELEAQRVRTGIKREASPIALPALQPPRKRHFVDLTKDE